MQFDGHVHATLPHEYASPSSTSHTPKSADQLSDGCRYKGWTLVDCGRWMYAVLDTDANERFRVCKVRVTPTHAIHRFRQMVDDREDAADLQDAIANDDGTRYTMAEVMESLEGRC